MRENEPGEIYIGECGPDGRPLGRGTIIFADGRSYSGNIDAAEQSGRGRYTYPDGSRLDGGFTIDREHPSWRFTYPDGRVTMGFVSRFPAAESDVEAGRFNAIDALNAKISRAASSRGYKIEYNARVILADALERRGRNRGEDAERAVEAIIRLLSGHGAGTVQAGALMISVPHVVEYIYGEPRE